MALDSKTLVQDLISFINNSPVSYFGVKNIEESLISKGYTELSEGDNWDIITGGRYFIKRNLSSIIAFEVGTSKPWVSGFNLIGAHTDSPLIKIKNESLLTTSGYTTLNVETYGGSIISSWLDRDLSIAGKVVIDSEHGLESKLIDFKRALGIIPNLAIHLNRDVNKGFEYNKQDHLSVILSGCNITTEFTLKDLVAKELDIPAESILEMDLFFYDFQKGELLGFNEDLVAVGRLDNLAMCHAILQGLISSTISESTKVALFFDNEEVGSRTMQGADSNFIASILDRIVFSLGGSYIESQRARFHSLLISADGAHAIHPNFSGKHDSNYSPKVNNGPVIKMNSNFRYSTTSESASKFIKLCKDSNVPYQIFINRSDMPCGSTIGPITSSNLGIESVDIGSPMLAMHSIRECMGVMDHFYITRILTVFFSS